MPGFPDKARRIARDTLGRRGALVLEGRRVTRLEHGRAWLDDGRFLPFDLAFLATGGRPPRLMRDAGLPVSADGALRVDADRRAAAGQLAALVSSAEGAGRALPETMLERALVAIVSELLTVEAGVEDDFFELGGDSVLATATVARIRKWLDTPTVGVPDIFAARSVRAP